MKKYLLTKLHETRNKKKKGFTLVELIVVLVILAILAALLIPALTGYIDNANEKKVTAEARTALMAAQTVISDTYGETGNTDKFDGTGVSATNAAKAMIADSQFQKLAEGYTGITSLTVEGHKITEMVYEDDDYKAVYKAESGKKSTWDVSEK